jgi:hypothetical protein
LFIVYFGQFTTPERKYWQKFADVNEFLHERGHLIDMIWVGFTNAIFDGNDKIEKAMFDSFVGAIISEFPAAGDSATASIQKQLAKIQSLINRRYTEDEAAIESEELGLAANCVDALRGVIIQDNREALVNTGFREPINADNETLAPALQSRMQHNILRMGGVKGGDATGKPPQPPAGETRDSAQAKIEAADPGRKASPEPSKPRKTRTDKGGTHQKRSDSADAKPAKKKKAGGDDEFTAGARKAAADSDHEDA